MVGRRRWKGKKQRVCLTVCIDLQERVHFDLTDQNQDLEWLPKIKVLGSRPRKLMVELGAKWSGSGVKFFPQKDQLLTHTHFQKWRLGQTAGSNCVSFIVSNYGPRTSTWLENCADASCEVYPEPSRGTSEGSFLHAPASPPQRTNDERHWAFALLSSALGHALRRRLGRWRAKAQAGDSAKKPLLTSTGSQSHWVAQRKAPHPFPGPSTQLVSGSLPGGAPKPLLASWTRRPQRPLSSTFLLLVLCVPSLSLSPEFRAGDCQLSWEKVTK